MSKEEEKATEGFHFIGTFDQVKPIQMVCELMDRDYDYAYASKSYTYELHYDSAIIRTCGMFGELFEGKNDPLLEDWYNGPLWYVLSYTSPDGKRKILEQGFIQEYRADVEYKFVPSEIYETGTYRLNCSVDEPEDEEDPPEPEGEE